MGNVTRAGVNIEVEGKEYEFSPLTIEDIEWLENWLKQRAIENGRASIPNGLDQAEKDSLMRVVLSEANKINIMGDGFDQLMSVAGMARMIWRMLQRKHSYMLLETIQRWMQDPDIAKSILPRLSVLQTGQPSPPANGAVKKGAHKQRSH